MQITLFTNGKANTKSVMKASISLVLAAMLLTAVLAVPAAAQKQVPFKGSLQGHETDTPEGGPPPTTLNVDGNTTGIATHVGQFSFSYQLTVTLENGTATGSAHLIAANGDSIYTTVAGSSEMTATPGVASITEINTITGGTGRFSGAPREFHCRAIGKPGDGLHLRFVPRDHYFPGCSETLSTHAEKQCREKVWGSQLLGDTDRKRVELSVLREFGQEALPCCGRPRFA